jgi:hypothetical protein
MARFEAAHRRNPGRCKCRQVSWRRRYCKP